MKYILAFIFFCMVCAVLVIGGFFYLLNTPNTQKTHQTIMIERGMGVRHIAANLYNGQFIAQPIIFTIGAKVMNGGAPLQAGEYELPAGASAAQILSILQNGDVVERRFTIPEGLTSWEIVQLMNTVEGLSGEIANIPAEGSLLPETYHYMKNDDREDKINRMQKALSDFQSSLDLSVLDNLPLKNLNEVMILASIVEKETSKPHEYERVAGVFINRLRIGMPLQTDPTVIYGMTMGKHDNKGKGPLGRRLLRKDLRVDTPYNTYTRRGLPPTPICNPGRAAIQAVLNPEDSDYLYFVANGTGGHAFAKTLAEHNRNVAHWRKVR